ncbi:MAG: carbohydrate ABC transporter permease, partial [Clostridia bacterium]|nr:carbohydrate ABC transporter permease [Clostridia bacterium]
MTKMTRLVCALLLIVTAGLMFMPIATFEDNSAAALQADIDKHTGRLESEQAKLQRYIDQGKKQADIDKQQAKVVKQQGVVDELLAEQAALAEKSAAGGLKYAFVPGKLPAEIEVDMQVVNANGGIYPTDFSDLYLTTKLAAVLLVLAAVCVLIPNGKLVSKFYTYSSFASLIGELLIAYSIFRVQAIPVKLPYGNPQMNWALAGIMLVLPLAALFINCCSVLNSKRSMIYVLCVFLCVLSLLPFLIMIVNATRNSQQIQSGVSLIPSTFLGHNWQVLERKSFSVWVGFKNSAIIAFGSTILSVYFSALTAYGLTVYRFKGAKFLYSVILAIIMIPGQVTATGFYMFMYRLGWTNSYLPLVIPSIAAASTVFFFKQYLEANFQISLVEAAR